ncbi:LacI family DNA-binding transcriptional regulator [Niameybacter massiliensis]|uniref:LacI family DNA-binding transcriptional regulator n=1 Tax=Niameybacter massiliensis TaxID=1658108 RepID=UPI0006B68A52|nr:LacI family DNA-binding transcriptional regulator [Niameybacter massiliensis]
MARKKSEDNRITSKEVAKLAHVSQATVSRVFSGEMTVKEDTRIKVIEAAKVLGYTPNKIASSLSSRKSNIIAVVLSDINNRFYTGVFSYLTQRLQENNKQVLFFQMRCEEDANEIINRVLEYQVDGVVIAAPALPKDFAEEYLKVNVPTVFFNQYTTDKRMCSVCSDSAEAGRMVANYFLDRKYTQFAFIGGRTTTTGTIRKKGFLDRLQERGIENCYIEEGDYLYEYGREAMKKLFEKEIPPNAVFCGNDMIAIGATDAVRHDLKLRVPEDVAIIGFDDIDMCTWESYKITSVHQPLEEMVDEIYEYFYRIDQGLPVEGGLRLLQCKIVERTTT